MIRNQSELNGLTDGMEDVWISEFPVLKQKRLLLNQWKSMKNLTIGINALDGVSVLELNGLVALERVVIMRGGLSGGSGLVKVTNCANLISIDIGEFAFVKYKSLEIVDLPLLRSVEIENNAFKNTQSIQFDSNRE